MTHTWPYFLELGVAAIFFGVVVLVSYGARDDTRRTKFLLAAFVYATTAVGAGGFALGQTMFVRDDGIKFQWGPWAMFALTHGAAVGVLVASLSSEFIDLAIGVLLGTGSGLFLLFAALTPISNGGNSRSAGILWVTASALCVAAVTALMAGLALGWRRFILFPAPYRSTDGRANVINRWWYVAVVIGTGLALAAYTILFAVGPSGWRQYKGAFEQIWLTMALADGLFLFILLPLVFYFLNPDGAASTETALEITQSAEPLTGDGRLTL